jgi:hypothetical protein
MVGMVSMAVTPAPGAAVTAAAMADMAMAAVVMREAGVMEGAATKVADIPVAAGVMAAAGMRVVTTRAGGV